MDADKKLTETKRNLFITHSEEINEAYERAVREALQRHKLAGNPVVTSLDGKVLILQPEDIETT